MLPVLLPADGDVLKKIATGVGFTCLLFAVALYIPIIGFVSAVMIPLPISYYRYKLGRSAGGSILGISCIVMMVVGEGISFDLSLFTALLILGLVLGEMLEEGVSVEKMVLYPSLSVIGSGIFLAFLYSVSTQTELSSLVNLYIKKNLELTLELYRQMSMPEETLLILSRSLDTIQFVLVRIIPGIAVMSALFVTWINMLMIRTLAGLKGLKIPDIGVLTQWKSPEILIWVVISGGVLLLIPVKFLKIVGMNIVLALVMIYFIQGISIVSFYFDKRKFPRILRGVLYVLIGVQQLFSILVIGLGFFDLWIDFRRIDKNEKLDDEF
jgi:uncharacterized protein YybS (DUF2232 family)